MAIPHGIGTGLENAGTYFNQVLSLGRFPTGSFSSANWVALSDLIISVLTNPFFYCIIGIIIIMTILPTVDDD